jgi:Pao retrotransposon peptidase
MKNDIFVDNIVTGCNSEEEAIELYNLANQIMKRGNFPLQSSGSNNSQLQKLAEEHDIADAAKSSKVLGLIWNRSEDTIGPATTLLQPASDVVKMKDVLSKLSSVYDPLGLYSPLVISGKILLQDLHKEGYGYEQQLSVTHLERWRGISTSVEKALKDQSLDIPRCYFITEEKEWRLHVFCDASRRAYGAVAYLSAGSNVAITLAKARIAPLRDNDKELTIPEAELMAAFIGTRLAETVIDSLISLNITLKTHMWCDSQIVLFWISKNDHSRIFVKNRVDKIQTFNKNHAASWHYVPTTANPADILSRGVTFDEFKSSSLWKFGPSWLTKPTEWPTWSVEQFKAKTVHTMLLAATETEPLKNDISLVVKEQDYNWRSLLRVTAVIFRVYSNLKLLDNTVEFRPNHNTRASTC